MEKRVLGVLGGRDLSGPMFKLWASSCDKLVAADSGADFSIEQGFMPHAVVGDMDSISRGSLSRIADQYRLDDQNLTDCDKLLDIVESWNYSAITLIGVEGDRLDHLMSTMHSCIRSRLIVSLAIRDGFGQVLGPGHYRIRSTPGRRISAVPLLETTEFVIRGVRWPLEGVSLKLGDFISVSNLAEEDQVEVAFETGKILLLQEVPHESLPIWPDSGHLAILSP